MEQSNKNITNADTLTSERERNLSKENGETQQANFNDENMQDLDNQQHSEKDTVQPEDVSIMSRSKSLKEGRFDLGTFRSVRKYLIDNAKTIVFAGLKYSSIRGLGIRGTEKVFGSPHIGNFMGNLELLAEFDPFICEHVELQELRPKSLISYL
ncbi:zinc finger MYM-type protein 1 [Trichonephila clavipes]|nr:zinc finger MYM-type protein 1 [Trichonephila clavipes]